MHIQFSKFIVVGIGNTLVSVVAYALLLLVGCPYLLAVVLAYAAALLLGYTLNRRWTFEAGDFARGELARYFTVQLLGLLINVAVVYALVQGMGADKLLAQAIALPVIAVVTFAGNRNWTFARD